MGTDFERKKKEEEEWYWLVHYESGCMYSVYGGREPLALFTGWPAKPVISDLFNLWEDIGGYKDKFLYHIIINVMQETHKVNE